jgi:hypothetical protein
MYESTSYCLSNIWLLDCHAVWTRCLFFPIPIVLDWNLWACPCCCGSLYHEDQSFCHGDHKKVMWMTSICPWITYGLYYPPLTLAAGLYRVLHSLHWRHFCIAYISIHSYHVYFSESHHLYNFYQIISFPLWLWYIYEKPPYPWISQFNIWHLKLSCYCHADIRGLRGYSSYSFLTLALKMWVVSFMPQLHFHPWDWTPGTHWIGGWVGLRASLDTEASRKISCPCRAWNPGCPVCSQTLHCLSHPT